MNQKELEALRTMIVAHKRWDYLFGLLGILALMIGLMAFATLFVDMAVKGVGRIDIDFLTSFPSRRAANAGILSAWVGSILVMLVTACAAVPLGVAAGVYLEEYAPKNWITDIIEINVTNLAGCSLDHLRFACARPVCLHLWPWSKHPDRRADSRITDIADRYRCHAGSDSRHSAGDTRRCLRLRCHNLASGARPHRALFQRGYSHRRDYRHGTCDRGNRANHHGRRADFHRLPADSALLGGSTRRIVRLDVRSLHGHADPDVQLDVTPGGGLSQ